MKTERRNLVDYYELSEAWQIEAQSNLEDYEDYQYIEPLPDQSPDTHALLDLSECMRCDSDSRFDGIIPVSNNCAIGIKIISGKECVLTYL